MADAKKPSPISYGKLVKGRQYLDFEGVLDPSKKRPSSSSFERHQEFASVIVQMDNDKKEAPEMLHRMRVIVEASNLIYQASYKLKEDPLKLIERLRELLNES